MENEVTFEKILNGMSLEEIDAYISKTERAIAESSVRGNHMIPIWQNGVDMAKSELIKRKQVIDGIV